MARKFTLNSSNAPMPTVATRTSLPSVDASFDRAVAAKSRRVGKNIPQIPPRGQRG